MLFFSFVFAGDGDTALGNSEMKSVTAFVHSRFCDPHQLQRHCDGRDFLLRFGTGGDSPTDAAFLRVGHENQVFREQNTHGVDGLGHIGIGFRGSGP